MSRVKLRQRRTSEHKASIKGQSAAVHGAKRKPIKMILTEEPVSRGTTVEAKSIPNVIRVWREKEEDEHTLLQRRLAAWIEEIAELEKLFKKLVYENKDLKSFDLRMHRVCLYYLLWSGEALAAEFLRFQAESKKEKDDGSLETSLRFIDSKLDELRETLHAWHGNLDVQIDIPQSFKDAIHELDRGELEPLDDILKGKTA